MPSTLKLRFAWAIGPDGVWHVYGENGVSDRDMKDDAEHLLCDKVLKSGFGELHVVPGEIVEARIVSENSLADGEGRE